VRVRRARPDVPVVGLDLSLTRPAAVRIPAHWSPGDWGSLEWWAGDDVPRVAGHEDDAGRCRRMIWISDRVLDFVVNRSPRTDAVFAEEYAFSQGGPTARKLAENGGVVRVELFRYGRVMRTVVAASARKFLLGKCPQRDPKVYVQAALWGAGAPLAEKLVRKYRGGWEPRTAGAHWGEDECDAFCVANWGRAEIGLTGLTLA
jgi:hypothetical protein